MSESTSRNLPNAWARHVRVQVTGIESRLKDVVAMAPPTQHDPGHAVTAHLRTAGEAIRYRRGPSRVGDWWRGTSVEEAFMSLHAARVALVDVLPDDDVKALVPDAVARVASCLSPTDPRRIAVEKLPDEHHPATRRAVLRHALEMSYAASDESHSRVRALRNVLLMAALLITIFMTCFIWFVSVDPNAVPLCFHPGVSVAEAEQAARTMGGVADGYSERTVCPTGEQGVGGPAQKPSDRDVQIVTGLGVLGGALASTVSIRTLSGKVTPYGIPVAVALLKLPIGGLTAVAGIILLGGAFVPGLSNLDSQRQILAYALVLGCAQQLVTQFIDRRASALLAQVPSRHPGPVPSRSMPGPAAPATSPEATPAPATPTTNAAMNGTAGPQNLP